MIGESAGWSPNNILRARKAFRQGATPDQIKAILESKLSDTAFRKAAAQQGFRWNNRVYHKKGSI